MKSDDDLEETIAKLIDRMKAAYEDSAEHRLIMRELEGLCGYETQAIMEDYGLFMNVRPPRSKNGARADPVPIIPAAPYIGISALTTPARSSERDVSALPALLREDPHAELPKFIALPLD